MGKTTIEWTTTIDQQGVFHQGYSFNPWVGCSKVSPGCDHCYAETWAKRSGRDFADRGRTSDAYWRQPLKWDAEAERTGVRRRVFCASLADVFDNQVPDEWRIGLWELIATTPHLDWLVLTKRIGNAARMLPVMDSTQPGYRPWNQRWPWPNVWLGATVVNQEEAERDIPKLLEVPARIRFLSCEPMLEAIDLEPLESLRGLQWIICGGESGSHARPLELAWAAELRAQAERRDISFFMKQGSAANWPDFKVFESLPPSVRVREFPEVT